MWLDLLRRLGMKLLSALLTEAFIKKLVIYLLEKLAERSDNKIDDQVVAMIKEALMEQAEEAK